MAVTLSDHDATTTLFGIHDENLRMLEDAFHVKITARGSEVSFQGDPSSVAKAEKILTAMQELLARGYPIKKSDVSTSVRVLREDADTDLVSFFLDEGAQTAVHRMVTPRNLAQKKYLQAMKENDMVFAIGPAGTGKTYLAVGMAAAALADKSIKRIILCRPAVEAGEKLGFLPGDLAEKVNPYLRPLYDSLYDLIGFDKVAKLLERSIIEIAPLAFMRGRTLSDAFIILDEAQNTTPEQMKMFLTRLGFGSKAVITGDITQIDLPEGKKSGLRDASDHLRGIEGVEFFQFTERDVVRHPLVSRLVVAYESKDRKEAERVQAEQQRKRTPSSE
jgi:phosphate starvation-inducible PhoH-like protein